MIFNINNKTLILMCMLFLWHEKAIVMEIVAFNAGQGNCICAKKNNKVVFIDAGYGSGGNKGVLIKNINQFTRDSIKEGVFVTHGHSDHTNLISDLGLPAIQGNPQKLSEWNIMIYTSLTVGKTTNSNANNLIYQMRYNKRTILFTGDAEYKTPPSIQMIKPNIFSKITSFHESLLSNTKNFQEPSQYKELLKEKLVETIDVKSINYCYLIYKTLFYERSKIICDAASKIKKYHSIQELVSDVLFIPHHGSATFGSNQFWNLIPTARASVISSNPNNGHKLPTEQSLDAIRQLVAGNAILLRTWDSVFGCQIMISMAGDISGSNIFQGGFNPVMNAKLKTVLLKAQKEEKNNIKTAEKKINKAEKIKEKAQKLKQQADELNQQAKQTKQSASAQKKESQKQMKIIDKQIKIANNDSLKTKSTKK